MRDFLCSVTAHEITVMDRVRLVSGNVNQYSVGFDIDDSSLWGSRLIAVFKLHDKAGNDTVIETPYQGVTITIPWEVLVRPGNLYFGMYALEPGHPDIRKTMWSRAEPVYEGVSAGETEKDPTMPPYSDLQQQIDENLWRQKGYLSLEKEDDYIYRAQYGALDYENAKRYFQGHGDFDMAAGCSAFRKDRFVGRKFDWFYNRQASFIISTPGCFGHYAVMGVAGMTELTEEFVQSGAASPLYSILPFCLYDGINEKGVQASILVVPDDKRNEKAYPTGESKDVISAAMLVRYILDNFATAQEAAEYIQQHVTVYFPARLHEMHYEAHYLVCDREESWVIEFENNHTVIQKLETPVLTNFHRIGITENTDGSVYTPATQDAAHDAMRTNGITAHGSGLERYNLIKRHYDDIWADNSEEMWILLNALDYTRAYSTAPNAADPAWLTEFVDGDLTCASAPADFDDILAAAGQAYQNRSRDDGSTWQSVHSAVYDLDSLTVEFMFQEDHEHVYTAEVRTSFQGEPGQDAVVDDTLTQPGQAADAAKVGEELSTLSQQKADLNQGAANAGKFWTVGPDGGLLLQTLAVWQGGSY